MDLLIRPARPQDTAAAGAICYAAFRTIAERHGFPPDFPDTASATQLLASVVGRTDIDVVVAELGGRVVGSNCLWRDGAVAGIGPITVDPGEQNRQVGQALMNAVLEQARRHDIAAVRLVQAAYHGRSLALYTKLGFEPREPLSLFQGQPTGSRIDGHAVRAATTTDLVAANALCVGVHGHARAGELAHAVAAGTAAVVEHRGRLCGYTTGIGFFGHAVAIQREALQALIAAAPAYAGPGFLVPTRDAPLMRWCLEQGLRIVQPMTLMTLGRYETPDGAFLPSILY